MWFKRRMKPRYVSLVLGYLFILQLFALPESVQASNNNNTSAPPINFKMLTAGIILVLIGVAIAIFGRRKKS